MFLLLLVLLTSTIALTLVLVLTLVTALALALALALNLALCLSLFVSLRLAVLGLALPRGLHSLSSVSAFKFLASVGSVSTLELPTAKCWPSSGYRCQPDLE